MTSYRQDAEAISRRIVDRVAGHYGRDVNLQDIGNITPAIDFRSEMAEMRRQWHRRCFIVALGAATAWTAAYASALAEAGRVYRLGILETISTDRNRPNLTALLTGMREHGYIEGQNLLIEYRSADGNADRFPVLAAELVRLQPDLIVTRGTPATRAVKQNTDNIPIVFTAIGEPVGAGVIPTLARPGGNVTGLSAFATELAGKRIELLKGVSLDWAGGLLA